MPLGKMTSYCMFQILSCNGPPVFLNPKSELSFGLPNIMPLFMFLAHQFVNYILGLAIDWSCDIPRSFGSGTSVGGGFDTAPAQFAPLLACTIPIFKSS